LNREGPERGAVGRQGLRGPVILQLAGRAVRPGAEWHRFGRVGPGVLGRIVHHGGVVDGAVIPDALETVHVLGDRLCPAKEAFPFLFKFPGYLAAYKELIALDFYLGPFFASPVQPVAPGFLPVP